MNSKVLDHSRKYVAAGFSVIPVRSDGSKAPAIAWKEYTQRQPTDVELNQWFDRDDVHGIGLVAGTVSGNLEVLDIDDRNLIKPFVKEVESRHPGLLEKLTTVQTPRGHHFAYRHDGSPEGSQKLAMKPPADDGGHAATLLETKGAGGYIVAPKSPGACHPSGKKYVRIAGPRFSEMATITACERDQLIRIARGFNEFVDRIDTSEPKLTKIDASRPGDDFNENGDWDEILEPHDWKCIGESGELQYWRRPGKTGPGWSATTGVVSSNGRELLCVFSSNAVPFPGPSQNRPCSTHTKFDALALLDFNGDHGRAALELAEHGYGKDSEDYDNDQLRATPFTKIKPRNVKWLWQDRFPVAKFTVVSGDPGVGKSFFFCDLAARASKGESFPDGANCQRGAALIVSCEDGADDTLHPRLVAHGADLSRVHFVTMQTSDGDYQQLDLGRHLKQLESLFEKRHDARLIVFDPISAYLGNIDSNSNTEVRRVLGPLCELAQEHHVAIVGVSHLTKREGRAVSRTLGSMAFVAAARANWIFARDPDDRDRRLMLQGKNNLADAPGLAFRIVDGRLRWEDEPIYEDADQILERKKLTQREVAEAFLERILAKGAVSSSDVKSQATEAGIKLRTLERAKKDLAIESQRVGTDWLWSLPPDETASKSESETSDEWIVD